MNSRFKKFIASAAGFFDLSRHERVGAYAILAVLAIAVAAMALASRCTRGGVPAKVQRVPDDEWETLLGRPIPADTVKIDRNMTLGELNHSRSPLGWLIWLVLTALLNASYKRGKPDLNVLFQYNMPLRALAKMTSGAISMGMVDGIVMELQGFWIIGLVRVIIEAVKNLVLNAQLEQRLRNS